MNHTIFVFAQSYRHFHAVLPPMGISANLKLKYVSDVGTLKGRTLNRNNVLFLSNWAQNPCYWTAAFNKQLQDCASVDIADLWPLMDTEGLKPANSELAQVACDERETA